MPPFLRAETDLSNSRQALEKMGERGGGAGSTEDWGTIAVAVPTKSLYE